MATKLPKTLPDCLLLNELSKKAEERNDIDFKFISTLDDFRKRVSEEVRQINELFPEYTPHDEGYHLNKLFHVADTVLEKKRIESLHSSELFLIALALYGHDWGMAVNEVEKSYILTGDLPKGCSEDEIHLLANERDTFRKFAKKHRLELDEKGFTKGMPLETWREYVRETHAARSGVRVKKYFEKIDGGVAEGCSRLCEGHYLNFEQLDDHNAYPADFSVLSKSVNLRACTIYVRLIDLLDLAEDRTPYVIWKFVAPRDLKSKMEWEKHRALRPVTCPQFQEGRVIRVDGSTADHEVYAALEDLKQWCEDQLRGCNNILARMNDPRHKLDLYHIEWRVVAHGFDPVSMKFEFNRERMFEILGDEIYEGDHYVFLRELLQNSIDAIRMRKEVLEKNGLPSEGLGVIKVDVQHGDNGDALVTWTDDGLGMDEYIIRNYLAVAGKSYYHSVDFEREGLKMDPISRFGIGVLSCFMVADCIEIETVKEPYMQPSANPLKITIPAMTKQFRVEELSREGRKTGTEFRVYVKGEKIVDEDTNNSAETLDVTRYLSIVAGFVEFPIVITEGERKTVVLHPRQDVEAAKKRFGCDFAVHQLDLTFPWEEAILPQDLQVCREIMREVNCNLHETLGDDGYDGVVVDLVPRDGLEVTSSVSDEGHSILGEDNLNKKFRNSSAWERRRRDAIDETLCKSAAHSVALAVYRDGILLPAVEVTTNYDIRRRRMCIDRNPSLQKIRVNLPKSVSPKVDVARTRLLGHTHWDAPIKQARTSFLFENLFKELPVLDLDKRFFELCRFTSYFDVELELIEHFLPIENIPLPFIESGGHLNFLEWKDIFGKKIPCLPPIFRYEIGDLFRCHLLLKSEEENVWRNWNGANSLIVEAQHTLNSTEMIGYTMRYLYEKYDTYNRVQFLTPPWESVQPIYQNIIEFVDAKKVDDDRELILKKASTVPHEMGIHEIEALWPKDYTFPRIASFEQPFEEYFSFNNELLNAHHPVTLALLSSLAKLELLTIDGSLQDADFGSCMDAIRNTWRYKDYETFSEYLRTFLNIAAELGTISFRSIDDIMPGFKEFIPGSLKKSKNDKIKIMDSRYGLEFDLHKAKPFGKPLTKEDEERMRKELDTFYAEQSK